MGGYELICPSTASDWLAASPNNKTAVRVRCLKCAFETSVIVRNFHRRRAARCFCTGAVPWMLPEAHAHFLRIVATTAFEPMPELLDFAQWKRMRITNHSKVRLQCRNCGVVSENVEVNAFVNHYRSASCACRSKTQRTVFNFLSAAVPPGVQVLNEYKVAHWEESGRPMNVDIALVANGVAVLGIEVDGGQHFRKRTGFRCDFEGVQRRDFEKEVTCVNAGLPLVRVVQEDVHGSKFDWNAMLIDFATKAVEQRLACQVYRQKSHLYSEGSYASLRVGSIVEV